MTDSLANYYRAERNIPDGGFLIQINTGSENYFAASGIEPAPDENSHMRIYYMEQNEISTQTILDQKKLKKFIKDVVHDKKKLISIYKNKKITKRKLKEVLCKDEYLSMKKALSFGLIDKIIDRLP